MTDKRARNGSVRGIRAVYLELFPTARVVCEYPLDDIDIGIIARYRWFLVTRLPRPPKCLRAKLPSPGAYSPEKSDNAVLRFTARRADPPRIKRGGVFHPHPDPVPGHSSRDG